VYYVVRQGAEERKPPLDLLKNFRWAVLPDECMGGEKAGRICSWGGG